MNMWSLKCCAEPLLTLVKLENREWRKFGMIVTFNTRLSLTIEFLAGCTLSLLLETRKYMDWYLYFAPNMFDNQEA